MTKRGEALQGVLSAARTAFQGRVRDPRSRASLDRIFAALSSAVSPAASESVRLPTCRHLRSAADPSRFREPDLRDLVHTFLDLEPSLTWRRRGGPAPGASADFPDGHANAMLVGPGGLEPRDDVWIGVSLLAPGVRYPDHSHPPEETYLVLGPGLFRQQDGPWFAPGPGGSFYNPPGILHAMKAEDDAPLFALWALWAG